MSSSDDRCAHHPQADALVTCMSCDLRVCRDCIDVESGADSCRPCVAARPPVEQRPPSQSKTAVEQRPEDRSETAPAQRSTDRSSTAVVLGWFGLLFGMFSPIVPPFAMISPLVLLGLGISVLVMASRDLEDIRQGRLPPDFKSRARHAQVVGVLNLLAVLLCGALAVALFWFFANWSH